ncbi:DUF2511 domain-containing protein [Alloalcanivorax xenomutans]|uniref:DUF2511 domain-containing protein n=1 Tax=Alloalcanivorax xenomutans TaxID=1094342 RepID=UPI003BAACAEE
MRFVQVVISLLVVGGMLGCSDSDTAAPNGQVNPSMRVTEVSFSNGPWPFTFEAGEIQCQERMGVALKTDDGALYALNGTGTGVSLNSDSTVWKDNPEIPGTKVSLSSMINYALESCGYR